MRKNLLTCLALIIIASTFFISCTKNHLDTSVKASETSNVVDCGTGQHWDFYLRKCVPDCPSGQHNDSITGACVIDGGGTTITVITNPNNPDEVVGSTHNTAMTSILPNYYNGLQPTQQNVFSYTKAYLISKHYDSATINYSYNYSLQHNYYRFPTMPSVDSVAIRLYNDRNISSYGKTYAIRLSSLINSLSETSPPTQTIYANFANQCITYENQISNDHSLSSNDKNILLSAHSVARYSCEYWFNYYNSGQYSVNQQSAISQSPSPQFTTGWFHWKSTVGNDVAGALGGAAGGAIAGAIAGGVGAGPGALAGGIGGGVGASVQDAAMQVWNHFFGN